MLSKKYAEPVRNILILVLIGVFSFFVVTSWLPDRDFIQDSLESVEESSNTVMKFSAATLSTSLAISGLSQILCKHCRAVQNRAKII